MLALNKGKPEQMNLKEILSAFIDFREEVVTKRTVYDLKKARNKAHILIGLVVANNNIDAIIELIKDSKDAKDAKVKLIKTISGKYQNLISTLLLWLKIKQIDWIKTSIFLLKHKLKQY